MRKQSNGFSMKVEFKNNTIGKALPFLIAAILLMQNNRIVNLFVIQTKNLFSYNKT